VAAARDEAATTALEQWRDHESVKESVNRPSRRAMVTVHLLAGAFLTAAVGLALSEWPAYQGLIGPFVALVGVYAAAYRFEFQAAAGSMVPTEPVLVAMLVTGPLELVPLAVMVGILLAGLGDTAPAPGWYGRSVRIFPAWHTLGPTTVLLAAGVRQPDWGDWRVLAAALVAQFALDAVTAGIRMESVGVDVRTLVRPLGWTFRVDTLMAVIGLGLATGTPPGWSRVAVVAAPVLLVRMLGRDRSEQVQAARSLGAALESVSMDATQDPMTGLVNRRGWETALARTSAQLAEGSRTYACVIAADLDGLKYANDTFGHEVGDRLITRFAQLLAEVAPPGGVAARLGGDEFALLMAADAPIDADLLIRRIREAVHADESVGGARLSASLGWAATPPLAAVEEAVRAADEAAGRDKQQRRAGRRTDPPPAPDR
jgi:diguanylate cyclase (GGDEF)-like protein